MREFWRWVVDNESKRGIPILNRVFLGLGIAVVMVFAWATAPHKSPLWIAIPIIFVWPAIVVIGIWDEWKEGH